MLKYKKNEAKQWIRQNLTGDITTLHTCFKEDGEVDYEAERFNFRKILEFGSEGYAVNAFAGEQDSLTKEEKKKILELAVEEAHRNKVHVITSAIGPLSDVLERIKHAEDLGVDAIWLGGPIARGLSEEGIYQWYKYIADRVNIALGIFNTASAYPLGPWNSARLAAECPNIVSLKTCPPAICWEMMQALQEFNTKITLFMPFHSGFPCVLAGIIPPELASYVNDQRYMFNTIKDQPATRCWELAKKGELTKAAEIFYSEPLKSRVEYVNAKFRRGNTPSHSSGVVDIPLFKYWQELIGLKGGPCRLPYLPPSEEEKRDLRKDLLKLGLIQK